MSPPPTFRSRAANVGRRSGEVVFPMRFPYLPHEPSLGRRSGRHIRVCNCLLLVARQVAVRRPPAFQAEDITRGNPLGGGRPRPLGFRSGTKLQTKVI